MFSMATIDIKQMRCHQHNMFSLTLVLVRSCQFILQLAHCQQFLAGLIPHCSVTAACINQQVAWTGKLWSWHLGRCLFSVVYVKPSSSLHFLFLLDWTIYHSQFHCLEPSQRSSSLWPISGWSCSCRCSNHAALGSRRSLKSSLSALHQLSNICPSYIVIGTVCHEMFISPHRCKVTNAVTTNTPLNTTSSYESCVLLRIFAVKIAAYCPENRKVHNQSNSHLTITMCLCWVRLLDALPATTTSNTHDADLNCAKPFMRAQQFQASSKE